MHITKIQAREILDSRGNPTVEADVILKMEPKEEPVFRQEHQQEVGKPVNFVMVMQNVTMAKVYNTQSLM